MEPGTSLAGRGRGVDRPHVRRVGGEQGQMGPGTGHGPPGEPIPGAVDPTDRPLRIDPVPGPGRLRPPSPSGRATQRRLDAHRHHRRNEAQVPAIQLFGEQRLVGAAIGAAAAIPILIVVGSKHALESSSSCWLDSE